MTAGRTFRQENEVQTGRWLPMEGRAGWVGRYAGYVLTERTGREAGKQPSAVCDWCNSRVVGISHHGGLILNPYCSS